MISTTAVQKVALVAVAVAVMIARLTLQDQYVVHAVHHLGNLLRCLCLI